VVLLTDHYIYLFINGIFSGIDEATANNGKLLWRYKEIEIKRNTAGTINSIDQYAVGEGRFLRQHTYKKNNNVIIANDGLFSGVVCAVLVEEEAKYFFYGDHQRYNRTPDKPETTIEFINDDVIITEYSFLIQKDRLRYHFINGILMKKEFIDERTETYTVSSGKGEIIVTKPDGTEIERSILERRVNVAGFLEYEAVKRPNGTGYEYFFIKDTFN